MAVYVSVRRLRISPPTTGQPTDKCGDFVPGFPNDNRLAVLDLARREVQIRRDLIDDHGESGNTRRRLYASGSALDRFDRNAREVQFLANVADDFKPAQLE